MFWAWLAILSLIIMGCSNKNIMYKMKTDGSLKRKLNDDDTWYVSIIGYWVYYERYYEDNGIFPLYRIRFDGSQRTKIT